MHILTHNINLVKYFLVQKGNKMKTKTSNLSYLDLLIQLKKDLDSDDGMPTADHEEADKLVKELFDILWKYSY